MTEDIELTQTNSTSQPALSVVLLAHSRFGVIGRAVAHLERQSIAARIELLLMTPRPRQLQVPDEVAEAFWSVRKVDVGKERRVGAVRAMGIEAAQAPFVAMCEDHCYINAEWAERLLEQHAAGADVVGPVIENANPVTTTSWVAHLVAYGPWIDVADAQTVDFLPGHNSCYRRELVLKTGPRLYDVMCSEVILHWELRDQGCKLVCEPRARARHVNMTGLGMLTATMYDHARNFGWLRSQRMTLAQRWIYAMLSPLIPAIRLYRSFPLLRNGLPEHIPFWRTLGELGLVLFATAFGEALGLLYGAGQSPLSDWDKELDRIRFVRDADAYLLLPTTPAGDTDPLPRESTVHPPLRVGLIGAGRLSCEVHLPVLNALRDAKVVAVADPDARARDKALSLAPGARGYERADDLFSDKQVQAVVIAAPSHTHASLAQQAFAAGKHLYLEKPLATTLEDGQRVVASWRDSGKIAMVGFNYRLRPDYMDAARMVAVGLLGKIQLVNVRFTLQPGQAQGWRSSDHAGGGVLLDLGSHEFDLVHFVLGEPIQRVRAIADEGSEDGQSVYVEAITTSGIVVRGFFSSQTIEDAGMEVVGTSGKITIDRYAALSVDRRGVAPRGPIGNCLAAVGQLRFLGRLWDRRRAAWHEKSFQLALARFVSGVVYHVQPRPDLEAGLSSLRVVVAVEQSLITGETVEVDSVCQDDPPKYLLNVTTSMPNHPHGN